MSTLQFVAKGNYLLSFDDQAFKVFDTQSRKLVFAVAGEVAGLSEEQSCIVVVTQLGKVHIYELSTGKILPQSDHIIESFRFHQRSRLGLFEFGVTFRDLFTSQLIKEIHPLPHNPDLHQWISTSKPAHKLIGKPFILIYVSHETAISQGKEIMFINTETMQHVLEMIDNVPEPLPIYYSQESDLVAVQTWRSLIFYDLAQRGLKGVISVAQPLNGAALHPFDNNQVALAQENRIQFATLELASQTSNGSMSIKWRTNHMISENRAVKAVAFHPSGNFLVAKLDNGLHHIYNTQKKDFLNLKWQERLGQFGT